MSMKTNDAPERMWINPTIDLQRLSGHLDKNSIEYTRTDAFIEKAAKWINEHTSLSEKLVIENFRKFMRGE